MNKAIHRFLETMLPRFVSILDRHVKTVHTWKCSLLRAIHNILTILIYAGEDLHSFANHPSLRSLIDYLLRLLSQPVLIGKIHANSNNNETLLLDGILIVLTILVRQPDILNYIKQSKPAGVLQQLTSTSHEHIVRNSFTMLAYTAGEDNLKPLQKDFPRLLTTIVDVLKKDMATRDQLGKAGRALLDQNVAHLLETLRGNRSWQDIHRSLSVVF